MVSRHKYSTIILTDTLRLVPTHHMIVRTVNEPRVISGYRPRCFDICLELPRIGRRIPYFAILSTVSSSTPRASQGEDRAVWEQCHGMISARNVHVGSTSPRVCHRIVNGECLALGSSCDGDATIRQDGRSWGDRENIIVSFFSDVNKLTRQQPC